MSTFFEAKNSGRGIRRKAWGLPCAFVKWEDFDRELGLKPADIDATDWEIEPEEPGWLVFAALFLASEGFEPNPRDKHARMLYGWWLSGACSQTAGKVNVNQEEAV